MKRLLRFMGSAVMAAMLSLGIMPLAGAREPGAHVHGLATLEVAIDGAAVQISLDSPLDNLLGFERAPRNEKERQSVKAMALKLHQADTLFVFTPAAQCRLESARLESAVRAVIMYLAKWLAFLVGTEITYSALFKLTTTTNSYQAAKNSK